MQYLKPQGRSRRVATIVLVLAVADGAGIYFAHNKLTQPWQAPAGAGDKWQVAEAVAPAVVRDDKLPQPAAVAHYDFPAPAAAGAAAIKYEPLPVAEYRTVELDLAQYEEAGNRVERETVIPKVRMASLRASRHQPTLFSSAFPADIARPEPAGADAPNLALAASDDATGAAPLSALPTAQVGSDALQLPAQAADAQVVVPAPEPGAPLASEPGTTPSDTVVQESAPQSIPAAPGTNGGSEAELPAL